MSLLGFLPARKARQLCQIFVKLRSMEELSVISLMYEVYKKLLLLIVSIDKKYRPGLTDSALRSCDEVIKQLLFAKYAPKTMKGAYLISADTEAELLAMKIRMVLELKLANETNVLKIQAKLTEARKQIGGWRKSLS